MPTSTFTDIPPLPHNLSQAFPAQIDAAQLFASRLYPSDVFEFAPCVADVTADTVELLDDGLKIIISAATQALGGMALEHRSWESIVASMTQNPFLEPDGHEIKQTFRLVREGTSFFNLSPPKTSTPKEVDLKQWVGDLFGSLPDPDLLYPMPIFVEGLEKIASAALAPSGRGGRVEPAQTGSSESNQRVVADIGVLRYPTLQRPYLRVYRVRLVLWSTVERTVTGHSDRKTGITAEHCYRRFKPRHALISDVPDETKRIAITSAAALFDTSTRAKDPRDEKAEKELPEEPTPSPPPSSFGSRIGRWNFNFSTFFSTNKS